VVAPRLEFRQVSRRFAPRRGAAPVDAVVDVSLALRDGEIVSLIGPSGCGKSTLLNLGAGLDRPSAGTVLIDGAPVTGPSEHVAIMLQKDLLLPWRTIRANVEFGLEIHGAAAPTRHARSTALLRQCRLEDFAAHYPHQLSGGMRQRAALARTLAVEPSVLLLDEPFSALDAQTKMVLQQDLARTLQATGKTALFITHDLVEAVTLSDRVLVMSARPGRIVEEIAIELPRRDDPLWRREQPRMAEYVPRLMALLHLREAA
jgi:NitT/TauT family transport system ATP-binding protein